MIRADLETARAAWIEQAGGDETERKRREQTPVLAYRDAAGRVFDFHALRHHFISNLAAAGVHPKAAQLLARHSTIRLTMDRYTHLGLCDLAASVNALPSLPVEAEERNANVLRPTGTEGGVSEVTSVMRDGAQNGALLAASARLQIAPDCTETGAETNTDRAVTPRRGKTIRTDSHELAPDCTVEVRKGPSRIRTGDGGFAIRCLTAWLRGRAVQ